jgi:hypothetical protein
MTENVGVSAAAFFDYLPSVPEAKRRSDSTRRLRVISLSCRRERGMVQNHLNQPSDTASMSSRTRLSQPESVRTTDG